MKVLTLEDALVEFRALGPERFAQRHPAPVLVVPPKMEENGEAMTVVTPTGKSGFNGGATDVSSNAPRVALSDVVDRRTEVVWLVKSDRNPFVGVITLGRAANNDVVFPVRTVSKVHLIFECRRHRWHVSDRTSTNGTLLNGDPLQPERARRIDDGNTLRLGPTVVCTFFSAQGFCRYLEMVSRFVE